MKTVIFARVSTNIQEYDRQVNELTALANDNGWSVEAMFAEKISDILHLPMSKAKVTRLDLAQNFMVKYEPSVYMHHLGDLKHSTRSMIKNSSLYYNQANGLLIFYDKVKEQKAKANRIPELYTNRNVLRYEQRYTRVRNSGFLNKGITDANLYDEQFYIKAIENWKNNYNNIQKINDINLNFEMIKTKKQLQKISILSMVKMQGGQLKVLEQIKEARKKGEITNKQAYDLRNEVNNACSIDECIVTKSDVIDELDKKVKDAIKFYR